MALPAPNREVTVKHSKRSKVPEERRRDKEDKLIAENRRLRKQVAQLQKQIAKIHNREIEVQEIMDEYEQHQRETDVIEGKPQCPMCGSYEVSIMEKLMNDLDYFACGACGGRGKLR